MAKTATPSPAYEPEAIYDLVVARPVYDGAIKYLPRHPIEATGELINRIVEKDGADAIRSADRRE